MKVTKKVLRQRRATIYLSDKEEIRIELNDHPNFNQLTIGVGGPKIRPRMLTYDEWQQHRNIITIYINRLLRNALQPRQITEKDND